VATEADDSENEADGVLDNQLAELEKKDVEKVAVRHSNTPQPASLSL